MHAGDLASFHAKKFRLHWIFRDDRLDGFRDLLERKTKAVSNHGDGLRQTMMLDYASGNALAKFLRSHSRAYFFLERQAALGSVHNAHAARRIHALRHG